MEADRIRYTITAPVYDNDGEAGPPGYADGEEYAEHAARAVAEEFGAYTSTRGEGFWTSSDGCREYREDVIIFTIDFQTVGEQRRDHWARVAKVAADIRDYAGQEAVYITSAPIYGGLI